ncbi:MAG: hypothetical protein ACFFG0_04910 [Candidatus Thorarchaeota archaeon]
MNELQIIFMATVLTITIISLIVVYIYLHIACWNDSIFAKAFYIGIDTIIGIFTVFFILGMV